MDELRADVEALDESIADLAGQVERLAEVADGDEVGEVDLATAWFDALVQHRVRGLLIEDLRWELADLEERGAQTVALEGRLDDLSARRDAIGDHLNDLGRVEWLRRHAADLSALDAAFAELEPPIDWGAVEETLEEHRVDGDEG